jgi:four helix bundle protein
MPPTFDHEKLKVYQAAIMFVKWAHQTMDKVPKRHAVYNQLDRASTSIALNIAEGNGKYSPRDRCRYFDIARGSALESAAALDVLVAKSIIENSEIRSGKEILKDIVSMLVGLIRSHSDDRVCETQSEYGNEQG